MLLIPNFIIASGLFFLTSVVALQTTSSSKAIGKRTLASGQAAKDDVSAAAGREKPTLEEEVYELKHVVSDLLHDYSKLYAHTAKVTNNEEICAVEFSDRLLSVGRDNAGTHILYTSDTYRYGKHYIELWYHKDDTSQFTYFWKDNSPEGCEIDMKARRNDLEEEWGELNPFDNMIGEIEAAFKKKRKNEACDASLVSLRMSRKEILEQKYEWIDNFLKTKKEDLLVRARELKEGDTKLDISIGCS